MILTKTSLCRAYGTLRGTILLRSPSWDHRFLNRNPTSSSSSQIFPDRPRLQGGGRMRVGLNASLLGPRGCCLSILYLYIINPCTCFRPPPQRLCAGTGVRAGRIAPACAPERPAPLSLEKHICFETNVFDLLFLDRRALHCAAQAQCPRAPPKNAIFCCAQAQWFVRVAALPREAQPVPLDFR